MLKYTIWIEVLGHLYITPTGAGMETNSMKLPVHSFCPDVNARGGWMDFDKIHPQTHINTNWHYNSGILTV